MKMNKFITKNQKDIKLFLGVFMFYFVSLMIVFFTLRNVFEMNDAVCVVVAIWQTIIVISTAPSVASKYDLIVIDKTTTRMGEI